MRSNDLFFYTIMGLILLSVTLVSANMSFGPSEESYHDIGIVGLKDSALIHGEFALGSGIIDQRPSFMYYQVAGNGYQFKSVPASMTTIIEDENNKPFIRIYDKTWYTLVGHNKNGYKILSYEIHVPEETIIRQFNLDSEV